MIEDKTKSWGNDWEYFDSATVSVTRVVDGGRLWVSDIYTTGEWAGISNFLSWQVKGWKHDTLYEVEINNVSMQSGETRSIPTRCLSNRTISNTRPAGHDLAGHDPPRSRPREGVPDRPPPNNIRRDGAEILRPLPFGPGRSSGIRQMRTSFFGRSPPPIGRLRRSCIRSARPAETPAQREQSRTQAEALGRIGEGIAELLRRRA